MFFLAAFRLRASFRVVVCLLVAVILVVPAAIRATQPVKAASTLRLNRGFDLPVTKQSVPQPDLPAIFLSILTVEPASAVAPRPVAEPERALPDSPDWPCPDPLRGPPVSFSA